MYFNSFEEYLQEVFSKSYMGTDDDMPDRFDHWLENQDVSDIMEYAQHFRNETTEKLIEEIPDEYGEEQAEYGVVLTGIKQQLKAKWLGETHEQ